MADLAKGGVKAFESELKIASPSKEMEASASWIGPGVAKGVDKGQAVVERSMARLVDPEDAMPQEMRAGATSTPTSITFRFGDIVVQSNGNGIDKPGLIQGITEACEDALRQMGLTPRPA